MPKYTFECSCGDTRQAYVSIKTMTIQCKCGELMHRCLPSVSSPEVKEVYDPYTNIALSPDHKSQVEERKLDHYWSEIVPRLVAEYPLEHSLQQGWIYFDDQERMHIHTKPPHKR